MTGIVALATHLPLWGSDQTRSCGPDEDAVTLAVAVGRLLLGDEPDRRVDAVSSVVLLTREVALLDTGTPAVLLAGLGLPADLRVTTVLAGAPGALEAVAGADPRTLLLAVDAITPAAAGAVLIGETGTGASVSVAGRVTRSLPTLVRDGAGREHDYADARLQRERGLHAGLRALRLPGKPVAVAGVAAKEAASIVGASARLPSLGAAAALFALADVLGRGETGIVVGVEQAVLSAVDLGPGMVAVREHAPPARAVPPRRPAPGPEIGIALPAYDRAFDAKVGLQAGSCPDCGTLALPPRRFCLGCGRSGVTSLVALPRTGVVHTVVTIRVPVPGLTSPYSIAVVEIGDTGVRLTAPVTDAEPGSTQIGHAGELVLRRIATRAGVPDYGYAFVPDAFVPDAFVPAAVVPADSKAAVA